VKCFLPNLYKTFSSYVVMVFLWVGIGVVVFLALITFVYYNKFVRLGQQIDNSLAQISVQLKRRSDLIPNLVSAVKGYMKHEKAAIKEVTDARKALVSAQGIEKKVKAGNQLQAALKSIFAIAEGYPDLKANTNFLQLQEELTATEDKVAYARQYYNDGIMSYNISRETIPGKWFASMFGFGQRDYLKIEEAAKAVPKVDL
jgi:LemA protein